jgi:hypothetical protein
MWHTWKKLVGLSETANFHIVLSNKSNVEAMLPCTEVQMDAMLSTLYAAATEALVSETSATSTFEKMIAAAYTHSTVETFTKELKDTEKQIKKDFEVGSMPGPWRSAKSVIQSAMKLGISLVDDNGGYRGKSALQQKIKEAKPVKEDMTSQQYADKIIKALMEVPEELDAVEVFQLVKDFVIGSN